VPTYEYACELCQRVFEVRQRISDPPLTTCEACGGSIRRLLSPAPFILKGGGWYVTDYPSEARKKGMDAEKPAEKPASSTGSPDAKSEAKSSTPPATTPTSSTTSSTPKNGEA
jgi:putative FmdB family regulatory protein